MLVPPSPPTHRFPDERRPPPASTARAPVPRPAPGAAAAGAGGRARQRDRRHAGHPARAGRAGPGRTAHRTRLRHLRARHQPAGPPARPAHGRPQPQPQPRPQRGAAGLRGPHRQRAVPADGPARGAAGPAFVPGRGRGLRDDRPAKTTPASSSPSPTPPARSAWPATWACAAWWTAGCRCTSRAWPAAASARSASAPRWTPTRRTASAPPSTCARAAAGR